MQPPNTIISGRYPIKHEPYMISYMILSAHIRSCLIRYCARHNVHELIYEHIYADVLRLRSLKIRYRTEWPTKLVLKWGVVHWF